MGNRALARAQPHNGSAGQALHNIVASALRMAQRLSKEGAPADANGLRPFEDKGSAPALQLVADLVDVPAVPQLTYGLFLEFCRCSRDAIGYRTYS